MPESVTQFLALAESIIRSVKEQQHTRKHPLALHHFPAINRFPHVFFNKQCHHRVKTINHHHSSHHFCQFSPSKANRLIGCAPYFFRSPSPAGRAGVVAHPRNSHGTHRRPNNVVLHRGHLLPGWGTKGRHDEIERLSGYAVIVTIPATIDPYCYIILISIYLSIYLSISLSLSITISRSLAKG